MISLEDVPEMVENFRTGELDFRFVYSLCLGLFEHNDVEDVLALLPTDLRDPLVSELRTTYDNDTPPDDYLLLDSARGDHPAKHVIINRIRAWIARHPAGPADHAPPQEGPPDSIIRSKDTR